MCQVYDENFANVFAGRIFVRRKFRVEYPPLDCVKSVKFYADFFLARNFY